jgi:shikimate kinase
MASDTLLHQHPGTVPLQPNNSNHHHHNNNNHSFSSDANMSAAHPWHDSQTDAMGVSRELLTSLDGRPPRPSSALLADNPNSSIVLVGARQTGKKSLAQIAAIALSRRVLDIGSVFRTQTGSSISTYLQTHSEKAFNKELSNITIQILLDNPAGAIVVVPTNCLIDNVQIILCDFAQTHLVINIKREPRKILQALGFEEASQEQWEAKLRKLLAMDAVYRRCSNVDFFNLGQHFEPTGPESLTPWDAARKAFSSMKRAERQFLKFLASAGLNFETSAHQDTFPLDSVDISQRPVTCAISVPLRALENISFVDIEQLEFGADAFEVFINTGDKSEYCLVWCLV